MRRIDEFAERLQDMLMEEYNLGWTECELEGNTILVDLPPDGPSVEVTIREQPF